jgi:hypothetical protein
LVAARSIGRRSKAAAEGQDIVGLTELRCVEGVECFGAELKAHLLGHLEALVDRDVGVIEAGSITVQSAGSVAVCAGVKALRLR